MAHTTVPRQEMRSGLAHNLAGMGSSQMGFDTDSEMSEVDDSEEDSESSSPGWVSPSLSLIQQVSVRRMSWTGLRTVIEYVARPSFIWFRS